RPAVKPLLQDPDVKVRQRVALALAACKEREAIPVLVALLGELPQNQAWQAEDVLRRLAGDTAPKVPLGADAGSRQRASIAWTAWWSAHGGKLDLSRLDLAPRHQGFTLIVATETG